MGRYLYSMYMSLLRKTFLIRFSIFWNLMFELIVLSSFGGTTELSILNNKVLLVSCTRWLNNDLLTLKKIDKTCCYIFYMLLYLNSETTVHNTFLLWISLFSQWGLRHSTGQLLILMYSLLIHFQHSCILMRTSTLNFMEYL